MLDVIALDQLCSANMIKVAVESLAERCGQDGARWIDVEVVARELDTVE